MSRKDVNASLDDVLFLFHQEVTEPTPEVVASWMRTYPEYASDIKAHAVEMLDMEARADETVSNLDSLEAKARSAALNAVYQAKQRSEFAQTNFASLREAAEQAGMQLRDLADKIRIARAVVVDVDRGAIDPETVTKKFVRIVAREVGRDFDSLRQTIVHRQRSTLDPYIVSRATVIAFMSSTVPSFGEPRTWSEAVKASDMTDELKSYWLSEE